MGIDLIAGTKDGLTSYSILSLKIVFAFWLSFLLQGSLTKLLFWEPFALATRKLQIPLFVWVTLWKQMSAWQTMEVVGVAATSLLARHVTSICNVTKLEQFLQLFYTCLSLMAMSLNRFLGYDVNWFQLVWPFWRLEESLVVRDCRLMHFEAVIVLRSNLLIVLKFHIVTSCRVCLANTINTASIS